MAPTEESATSRPPRHPLALTLAFVFCETNNTAQPTARFNEIDGSPDYHIAVAEGEPCLFFVSRVCVNANSNAGRRALTRPRSTLSRSTKKKKKDPSSGRILGTAALIVERKFIHGCGKVGHVEDVVVDERARGGRIGQR